MFNFRDGSISSVYRLHYSLELWFIVYGTYYILFILWTMNNEHNRNSYWSIIHKILFQFPQNCSSFTLSISWKLLTQKHREKLFEKDIDFFSILVRLISLLRNKWNWKTANMFSMFIAYCIRASPSLCKSQCGIFTILNIAWSSKKTNFVEYHRIVLPMFPFAFALTQPLSVCVSVWCWLIFMENHFLFKAKRWNAPGFKIDHVPLLTTLEWFKMTLSDPEIDRR